MTHEFWPRWMRLKCSQYLSLVWPHLLVSDLIVCARGPEYLALALRSFKIHHSTSKKSLYFSPSKGLHFRMHYRYHFSRSRFRRTIGLVIIIATTKADTINTSCSLLKFSLNTSNVLAGVTLVKNRSRPYANTSDVDSSNAGAVTMRSMWATYKRKRQSIKWWHLTYSLVLCTS